MTNLTTELIDYLNIDTLKNIQHDLETKWAHKVKRHRPSGFSNELLELMSDVNDAVFSRRQEKPMKLSLGQLVNRLALANVHVDMAGSHLARVKLLCEDLQADLNHYVAERKKAHVAVVESARAQSRSNPHPAVTVTLDTVFIDYSKLLDRELEFVHEDTPSARGIS